MLTRLSPNGVMGPRYSFSAKDPAGGGTAKGTIFSTPLFGGLIK